MARAPFNWIISKEVPDGFRVTVNGVAPEWESDDQDLTTHYYASWRADLDTLHIQIVGGSQIVTTVPDTDGIYLLTFDPYQSPGSSVVGYRMAIDQLRI